MKYSYEDLSNGQFENLVIFLCQHLLGMAVQGFATGPDGGRDAKFIGTAELIPSTANPWVGTTIIQAKHTNGYNRHFTEADFYSPKGQNTIVGKEIPRIKQLRSTGELGNYMLFANRRLSANIEGAIRDCISCQCNIPEASILLCGIEQLEIWLKRFPNVALLAELDPVDSPLKVSPDELAEIVDALARQRETVNAVLDNPPVPRVSYESKNVINNMSAEYAKLQRKKYLKETTQIYDFLAAPENLELQRMYTSVCDEFQSRISSKRKDYQTFDEIMEYLTDLLFSRDAILRQHKRLTRAMLFYMYWNCDIGSDGNAET